MKCTLPKWLSLFANRHSRTNRLNPLYTSHLTSLTSRSTPLQSRDFSIADFNGSLPDNLIQSDYDDLFQSIVNHVRTYYTMDVCGQALKAKITHATAGLYLPTQKIMSLLNHPRTREGALVMCISWKILSRCLLLKFGINNRPGSTFLPPEIAECFKSFSFSQVIREGNFHERTKCK